MNTPVPEPLVRRRRPLTVLAATALITASLIGLGTAVWWTKRSGRRQAAATAERAQEAFIAGHHGEAFTLFAAAAAQAPLEASFQKSAARAAFAANRRPEAVTFAKRAWELGLRDEQVLALLLLDVGQGDRAAVLARGEALIAELPDGAPRSRMRGQLLAEFGKDDEALKAFHEALALAPDTETVSAYGELLAKRQEIERLWTDMGKWRERGLLDATGYRLLAIGAAYRRQERGDAAASDPLDIINEAIAKQRYDDRLRVDHALHLCNRLRFAQALAVVDGVTDPSQRRDARLVAIWCLLDTGQAERLQEMASAPADTGPQGEGLALVLQAMVRAGRDGQERILDLARAERLLNSHAILRLFAARLHAAAGEPDVALRLYQSVTGLLAATPTILVEQAEVLAGLGRRDAALAMLIDLHHLHGATRRSLLLMGRLAEDARDPALIEQVRKALAEVPTNDADLQTLAATLSTTVADRGATVGGVAQTNLDSNQREAVDAIRKLLDDGQAAKALNLIARLDAPPAVREAWKGIALHALERHAEALISLAAVRADDQPALVDLTEAASALALGRDEEATAAARRAVAKDAADPDGRRLLALGLLEADQADEALAAVTTDPPLPPLAPVRALVLAHLGRRGEALITCREALARDPGEVLAANLAADLCMADGRSEEALPLLTTTLRARPDDRGLLRRLAACAVAVGDAAVARQALDRLVELRPNDADLALQRARVLALSGDLRAAQQAIDRLPPNATPLQRALVSALVQRCSGRPAAAMSLLQPLLGDPAAAEQWALLSLESERERPVSPVFATLTLDLQAWLRISFAAEQVGRWDEAVELLRLARAQHGDDTALLNNWAWCALHVPAIPRDQVLETARTAWSRAPRDPSLADTWCEVLLAAGQADECLAALDRLDPPASTAPQALVQRGRALRLRGDHTAAATAYREALTAAAALPRWPLRESRADLERLAGAAP